jgi:hypothetical protein
MIVLGRKSGENYFADTCTISKFSSYHIIYCKSGENPHYGKCYDTGRNHAENFYDA